MLCQWGVRPASLIPPRHEIKDLLLMLISVFGAHKSTEVCVTNRMRNRRNTQESGHLTRRHCFGTLIAAVEGVRLAFGILFLLIVGDVHAASPPLFEIPFEQREG